MGMTVIKCAKPINQIRWKDRPITSPPHIIRIILVAWYKGENQVSSRRQVEKDLALCSIELNPLS